MMTRKIGNIGVIIFILQGDGMFGGWELISNDGDINQTWI
jgi:hypothetical protein